MTSYSIYLHASINEEESVTHQIDFPAGITPALPLVGDGLGFTTNNRHYWVTIEERCFDYAECQGDNVNVFVCLMARVNGSSDASSEQHV